MTEQAMLVQCCFCGNRIVNFLPDPVELTIDLIAGEEQKLYCHYRCLKRSLDTSVPLFPLDAE